MNVGKTRKYLIIAGLSLFFLRFAHASNFIFNSHTVQSDKLAEWPDYMKTDPNKDLSIYGDSFSYFNKPIESCATSIKAYVPQLYMNDYSQFPLVPKSPILSDQLAVKFFKNLNDNQFYSAKWGVVKEQPLITFYLTPAAVQYKEIVTKVIEHINTRAQHYALVPKGKALILLANNTLSLDQENCNVQFIHFEEKETSGELSILGSISGMSLSKIDFMNIEKLGEIRDADVIIYSGNITKAEKERLDFNDISSSEQENRIKQNIYVTLMHEILHALGVDHNFALGTVMDYSEIVLNEGYDESLAYEMEVLNFLYNGKSKSKDWPLVRSNEEKYAYEPNEKYFFASEQWYLAHMIKDTVNFICKDGKEIEYNYTEKISQDFQIQLSYKEYYYPFSTHGNFDLEIKNMIGKDVLPGMHDMKGDQFARLTPKLIIDSFITTPEDSYDNSKAKLYIKPNSQEIWIYPNPFLSAYGLKSDINHIDWEINVYYPEPENSLKCNLKADFRIIVNQD